MKSINFFASLLLLSVTWTSCIKDEELNAEADITKCTLPAELLTKPDIDVFRPFDKDMNAYPIYLPINSSADVTQLAPKFELTPGATIKPENGSTQNFTRPIRYTVTSEDGMWHRTYAIIAQSQKKLPSNFHFETAKTGGKYHIIYEELGDHTLTWGSGNGGFALAVSKAKPTEYPTYLSPNGYKGNCVTMTTRETGSLGGLVGMPIASGNLFIGQFDIQNALSKPLEATKFGEPFTHKPISLKGHYRYKAGPKFIEKGKEVNKKDMMHIYAVFYEYIPTHEKPMLDGNIQEANYEDPRMVALALLKNPHETKGEEWEEFEITFDYERYGKTIDMQKLINGDYYLGIVFAASVNGAKFAGAPGSTLMIDEMELTYE